MLRLDAVSFEINNRPLVRDVSFIAQKGEMLALLGANGAGKSTMMRMLSGERHPSSGRITLAGRDLHDYSLKELAFRRGMLLQQNVVSLAFGTEEIVAMGRYVYGHGGTSHNDLRVIDETMEVCGITHLKRRSMLTLSGGEQQRVHLARVLAQVWDHPEALLLLDEPISGMDIHFQHQTLAIAAALARKGFTVVTVLHDLNLAAQYADRILMLKAGRKWWDGSPLEVLTPQNIYTTFDIHSKIHMDLESLKSQVIPRQVKLDAADFNSHMYSRYNMLSLKQRYDSYRMEFPDRSFIEAGETLRMPTADIIMTGLGDWAVLLQENITYIFNELKLLGQALAITSNQYVQSQQKVAYQHIGLQNDKVICEGSEFYLEFSSQIHPLIVAVKLEGYEGVYFMDRWGTIIHVFLLNRTHNKYSFSAFIEKCKKTDQEPFEVLKHEKSIHSKQDAIINTAAFHQAWENMNDTSDLDIIINRFGLSRLQALRHAPPERSVRLSTEAFRRIITSCDEEHIPVEFFVSNGDCVQGYFGNVAKPITEDSWMYIRNGSFELKINEDAISSVWDVKIPFGKNNTAKCMIWLLDNEGHLMLKVICPNPYPNGNIIGNE